MATIKKLQSSEVLQNLAASGLDEAAKGRLAAFVEHFPGLTWFTLNSDNESRLPEAVQPTAAFLEGFMPGELRWVRLAGGEKWLHWIWDTEGTSEYTTLFVEDGGKHTALFILCADIESLHTVLAMKMSGDGAVYRFDYDDVSALGDEDGLLPAENLWKVYPSYPDFLAQVTAIKGSDSGVVEAA
ncbi:MAG TPA: hypothetical protein PKW33_03860 [Anaerolineaceae bacterium]|nr:hypothetical protein [Anaerolineaceae bacterium]HPN50697.1 hypothetical protein [Anaerolineaceae bacterium]